MTALVLLALVLLGLCAAAGAEVEKIALTIYAVDTTNGQPIYALSTGFDVQSHIYLKHNQCLYPLTHQSASNPDCPCFDNYDYLSPCSYCNGSILTGDDATQMLSHTASATFYLTPGHEYRVFASVGSDYLNVPLVVVSADPETGAISVTTEHDHIRWRSTNELEIGFDIAYVPTRISFHATKLMNGKDPGNLKFAFKRWELTEAQWQEYIGIDQLLSLLNEDEWPEWKAEYAEMDWEEVVKVAFTADHFRIIMERLSAKLDQLPYTIIYSNGKTVPVVDETITVYDIWDERYQNKWYVIAEINTPGNGICEDLAVYGLRYTLSFMYPSLPISIDRAQVDPIISWPDFRPEIDPVPLSVFNVGIFGFSPGNGFFDKSIEHTEELVSDYFVFRNTTCPYADPGPTATPEPVPDVPATGDGGFPIYWAALLLVGVMAMILRPRRA